MPGQMEVGKLVFTADPGGLPSFDNVQNVQSDYTTIITQIVLVSWHFRNIENIKCIVINF